jgi:hypothetical protein
MTKKEVLLRAREREDGFREEEAPPPDEAAVAC